MMKFLAILLLFVTTADAQLISRRVSAGANPITLRDSVTYWNNWDADPVASLTVSSNTDLYMLIFVMRGSNAVIPPDSAKYGAQVLSQVDSIKEGGDDRIDVFGLADPTVGTANAQVWYGASSQTSMYVVVFSGVNSLGTPVNFADNWGTAPSIDVTSATGELVIDVIHSNTAGATHTEGAGQTEITEYVRGTARGFAISTEAGAATTTMSWTVTASALTQIGVPLKP